MQTFSILFSREGIIINANNPEYNDRTRINHGHPFRCNRSSIVRANDIDFEAVSRCGREPQHSDCFVRAHLHDCVWTWAANAREPSNLTLFVIA
jgi:hypothetical protein